MSNKNDTLIRNLTFRNNFLQNDDLQEMLYHTKWYMLPVEFRKLLVISMILTHQEIKFTWFGIYKINLEFYAKVLKALYSVVNIVFLKRNSVS